MRCISSHTKPIKAKKVEFCRKGRGRVEMNERNTKEKLLSSAKECAFLAVFVALLIASQLVCSAMPGVELVSVLFIAYSFVFGAGRGAFAAVAFSLLRCFLFGFFPTVLALYLVYYTLLAFVFGNLGKRPLKTAWKQLLLLTAIACVCTAFFTGLDNLLTPLWYGYTAQAWKLYAFASFYFMIPQIICTAITVPLLFFPLKKAFTLARRGL